MKRTVAVAIVTLASWMAWTRDAQAQALVTPTGPLACRMPALRAATDLSELEFNRNNFYPGRTMGGGPRILRSNPPPSSLKRRKE